MQLLCSLNSWLQGACLGPDQTMLVTEYCEGGNLGNSISVGRVSWYRRGKKVRYRDSYWAGWGGACVGQGRQSRAGRGGAVGQRWQQQ